MIMKLFLLTFCFYLISLSAFPCSDNEECNTISKTEITKISQSINHDEHSHQNEQCTPFCTCNCCGVHSFKLENPYFSSNENRVVKNKSKLINTYAFVYSNGFFSTILQPPKLS